MATKKTVEKAGKVVSGKHRGHVITGVTVPKEGKKDGLLVTNWTLNGKDVPMKHAKGFVGKTFDTVNKGGAAAFAAMNASYGTPKALYGRYLRSMVFGDGPAISKVKETKKEKDNKEKKERTETKEAPASSTKKAPSKPSKKEASKAEEKAPKTEKKAKPAKESATEPAKRKKADAEEKPKGAAKRSPKRTPLIKKAASQGTVAKGKTRYFCNACMANFDASSKIADADLRCKNGHKQDDAETFNSDAVQPPVEDEEDGDDFSDEEEDEDLFDDEEDDDEDEEEDEDDEEDD